MKKIVSNVETTTAITESFPKIAKTVVGNTTLNKSIITSMFDLKELNLYLISTINKLVPSIENKGITFNQIAETFEDADKDLREIGINQNGK